MYATGDDAPASDRGEFIGWAPRSAVGDRARLEDAISIRFNKRRSDWFFSHARLIGRLVELRSVRCGIARTSGWFGEITLFLKRTFARST